MSLPLIPNGGGGKSRGHPESLTHVAIPPVLSLLLARQSRARSGFACQPIVEKIMRRVVFTLASLAVGCLFVAGCDKCGDPVKFNVPGLPHACYDSPRQK